MNFLGRLSGIATQAHAWTTLLKDAPHCQLVDTRKTTPGWRALEKTAVRAGGGGNHSMGLFDGILIKENHIAAAGSLEKAIERAQAGRHHLTKLKLKRRILMKYAVELGVDAVMLDNMDNTTMAEAIALIREMTRASQNKVKIEGFR